MKKWNEEKEKKKKKEKKVLNILLQKHRGPKSYKLQSRCLSSILPYFLCFASASLAAAQTAAQRNPFFKSFFPEVKYRRIYDHRSYDRGVVVLFFLTAFQNKNEQELRFPHADVRRS